MADQEIIWENDHLSNQTIADWFYDRLSPDTKQAVDNHLDHCVSCSGRVMKFRKEQNLAAVAVAKYAI